MMQLIPIRNSSANYVMALDGYSIELDIRYSKQGERWIMDVFNKTKNLRVKGIVMNISTDLLAAANYLDLQVLMLINREASFAEASVNTLGTDVVLVYMDLLTYTSFYYDSSVLIRQLDRIVADQTITTPTLTRQPGQEHAQ